MRAERLILSQEGKEAIKRFRNAKPWRGTFADRQEKFETFHDELAGACGFTTKFEFVGEENATRPGNGGYDPTGNRIVLAGKLSVVTMLFCFGLVGELSRAESLKWSGKLFKHYFPRSFARCQQVGTMLLTEGR